jgi:hypothetical protein
MRSCFGGLTTWKNKIEKASTEFSFYLFPSPEGADEVGVMRPFAQQDLQSKILVRRDWHLTAFLSLAQWEKKMKIRCIGVMRSI